MLSSVQGARSSGNSEAGITGGQREGGLSTSLGNGDNGGQALDGASSQDVEVQSELITDRQIARGGRALGDVQAGWARESQVSNGMSTAMAEATKAAIRTNLNILRMGWQFSFN